MAVFLPLWEWEKEGVGHQSGQVEFLQEREKGVTEERLRRVAGDFKRERKEEKSEKGSK